MDYFQIYLDIFQYKTPWIFYMCIEAVYVNLQL
jgi:hypothetical protein